MLGRPDSLATIGLSDGATLTLSKTYGWVAGPALGSLPERRGCRARAWRCAALAGPRLGPAPGRAPAGAAGRVRLSARRRVSAACTAISATGCGRAPANTRQWTARQRAAAGPNSRARRLR
ncbi:MAG: hypothetical protein WKG07_30620 [Hymenobacter sp.]